MKVVKWLCVLCTVLLQNVLLVTDETGRFWERRILYRWSWSVWERRILYRWNWSVLRKKNFVAVSMYRQWTVYFIKIKGKVALCLTKYHIIKTLLCLIKHYTMMLYWGVQVQHHAFLTSALSRVSGQLYAPAALYLR